MKITTQFSIRPSRRACKTEIETSTQIGTRAQQRRQFARANFGGGLVTSKRAIQEAEAMLSLV
jgi:hypothetical protein